MTEVPTEPGAADSHSVLKQKKAKKSKNLGPLNEKVWFE